MKKLTQSRLKEYLRYESESGLFFWNVDKGINALEGKRAGTIRPNGYIQIWFDGKGYLAHRLAWLYVHGEFPPAQIDHINGQKSDNRLANLRSASGSQNQANVAKNNRNKCGFKGVYLHKASGLYQARISVPMKGKQRSLGYFKSPELAHQAYVRAASEVYGEFANFGEFSASALLSQEMPASLSLSAASASS